MGALYLLSYRGVENILEIWEKKSRGKSCSERQGEKTQDHRGEKRDFWRKISCVFFEIFGEKVGEKIQKNSVENSEGRGEESESCGELCGGEPGSGER